MVPVLFLFVTFNTGGATRKNERCGCVYKWGNTFDCFCLLLLILNLSGKKRDGDAHIIHGCIYHTHTNYISELSYLNTVDDNET